MKVLIRTNLDILREEWPDNLPTVPRIDDYIESKTIHNNNFRLRLRVCTVTWVFRNNEWVAEVELTMPKHYSLYTFYERYAPAVGKSVSAFI